MAININRQIQAMVLIAWNGTEIGAEVGASGLMYRLCRSVAFCRVHGVLHRDLKPHNLLLDRKTLMVKIRGFGLARAFTPPNS
ncbi:cyclin-dependent kinase [Tanacetum coccineum]|uniref:Cyclin-dependent kinase n=1 Tax=Tanacetum coccineum TaxID=301880 RepID=A0ABQ5CK02_9ASTR